MLTISSIRKIVASICEKYQIKSAYLFGSYARGEATLDSDIDLLVDRGAVHDYQTFGDFYFELKNELGSDIDIVTLNSAKPIFLKRIENDKVLLYGA